MPNGGEGVEQHGFSITARNAKWHKMVQLHKKVGQFHIKIKYICHRTQPLIVFIHTNTYVFIYIKRYILGYS